MSSLTNASTGNWVDHESYFGPDRRLRSVLRLRERRRLTLANPPPQLSQALRKLERRVLGARGHRGVGDFADRVLNIAILAQLCDEPVIQDQLNALARRLYAHRGEDVRPMIYRTLDHLILKQPCV